ncbi:MAG: hypothetical protein JXR96_00010 [Deltaproteobacteria bacterium]|nr:hypothetical protein [Deltaproteobacteria bacterium]
MGKREAVRWIALALVCAGLGACWHDCMGYEDCFDPDDPCPNDMFIDELGCAWDRCSNEFTGEQVPCWYTSLPMLSSWFTLAGSGARYIAYVRDAEPELNGVEGEIWLYDLETGEDTPLVEGAERRCFWLRSDGDRLGYLERMNDEVGSESIVDACVKDIETGEEWRIPNPRQRYTRSISMSGDRVAVTEYEYMEDCIGGSNLGEVFLFDLATVEKVLVSGSEIGTYKSTNAEIGGDRIAFWKVRGACPEGTMNDQLWIYDIESGHESLYREWENVFLSDDCMDFQIEGSWIVLHHNNIYAFDIESGQELHVTSCGYADCGFLVSEGMVAYVRRGEDGLDQLQTHVFELESGQHRQMSDMWPYFDGSAPTSFKDGRLMWSEVRGNGLGDGCGNYRGTDPHPTEMLFWKDIEFDQGR